ncbi:MAG: NADH-quinone oxidoreductase subunit NuoN [Gammaproteobacteria bacterium]|nr:NADH-quinone oxidoreductase subunit NuoN [Gammaproteobacteria bacterium]
MTPTLTIASLAPALPEIYLTAAICFVLLVDVFAGSAARRVTPTLTLLVIGVGAALTLQYAQVGQAMTLFSGMYVADPLATLLKLLTMLFVAVALLYSRHFLETRGLLKGEYYVLALTAMLGIFVIISAGSLLTLYIGIELLSLSLYALVAFDRDSGVAAESAMKYFVLGAIASGCLLYGMSLVYGLTGSLLLNEIAASLQGPPSLGLIMGVVFLVVGVAFKFGGVPFHMWVPDVYHGAPTSVTLLVATAPKIASFALAFRLFSEGLGNTADTWIQMLTIVAVLSALLGNVIAIAQTNLKRMLAYSAIGNVGFILFGFVAGNEQGYEAALYYTVVYVLMALGAFGAMLLAGARGFEADEIEHYKGLHARDPLLALILMALMFSFAGVPPLVGFWAKLQIFQALWESGHLALVVFAAAVSVIGLFYYLRIVKILYFDAPGDLPVPERHGGVRLALGLNALAVVLLGLFPQTLIELCVRALG